MNLSGIGSNGRISKLYLQALRQARPRTRRKLRRSDFEIALGVLGAITGVLGIIYAVMLIWQRYSFD